MKPIVAYLNTPPLTEEQLKPMSLLDKIEALINIAERSKLCDEFFQMHKPLIQSLAESLRLTPMQTVFLSPFFSNINSNLSEQEIEKYFSISPITFLKHEDDINTLFQRQYINREYSFDNSVGYRLHTKGKMAVRNNEATPVIKTTNLTAKEFMARFATVFIDYNTHRAYNAYEFYGEVYRLLNNNTHLAIAKAITSLPGSKINQVIMLYWCHRLVVENAHSFDVSALPDIFNDAMTDPVIDIQEGDHYFLWEKLIEHYNENGFCSKDCFTLTSKAQKLFLCDYVIPKEIALNNDPLFQVIQHKDIKAKRLFYSKDDEKQVEILKSLLNEKKLKTIRKSFEKAKMPKGFSCLFYGSPGTGKTETVLQLARATKRDILQVDISNARSAWYGESEKNIKEIFDNYDRLMKQSKTIPILLINEADALLSVRTEIHGHNSLEKTENNIQNIILEAMEHMDGILIATTNLTCNLDPAFDRRFLYKVMFHQPSIEAKIHIWQNFLPELSDEEVLILARNYDFSGGQIENVRRKVFVNNLLMKQTEFNQILEYCSQERISDRKQIREPIGFK